LALDRRTAKRHRVLVTPEGLALPISIASRSARAVALILDLVIMIVVQAVVTLLLFLLFVNVLGLNENSPAAEFLLVVWIILMFLFRYGYFLFFELGPRGATPGKRAVGIRIAAHDGGRLSVEAVIARNLLRDIEVFLPLTYLFTAGEGGAAGWLTFGWFLLFLLFPFFNRDALRAGDLIAGTWVVEMPKRKLEQAMSLGEAARGHSIATGVEYRFGDAELRIYGEYELQTLERVLRENNHEALVAVAEAICAKIGWSAGSGDERAFLEAFYSQLRARLERDMRFGKRKADKHS
jgi:uncharacterized RDD family membrane protein YckC